MEYQEEDERRASNVEIAHSYAREEKRINKIIIINVRGGYIALEPA